MPEPEYRPDKRHCQGPRPRPSALRPCRESALDDLLRDRGVGAGFKHEIHGLRVVDKLTNFGSGLNLTYEVRDGIVTHCGESFERSVAPDRSRDIRQLESIEDRDLFPATLEGCLVRLVDRIAYLGRDLEDALKAGIVARKQVPPAIVEGLGLENGQIIGCFVNDTIASSLDRDSISMSEEVFDLMNRLKEFNYATIYRNEEVERIGRKAGSLIGLLFRELEKFLVESERGRDIARVTSIVRDAPLTEIFPISSRIPTIPTKRPAGGSSPIMWPG